MSEEIKVKLIAEIPINTKVRIGGDEGIPIVEADPDSEVSKIFINSAREIIKEINLMNINTKINQDLVIEI
ncbi:MAG: Mrp/NBP35 family ATP-binding protein [Ignavibacteria bacterium]|nr:Mrp/NBP35 family ATP-binding protein [Ignavibacteria bacterium]